ncbi:hypothetical protein HOY82DRAFT_610561 [Tuber indicum]|nr:hypothetical protein HOY82DRAFT_610561 [Tuber indicum]
MYRLLAKRIPFAPRPLAQLSFPRRQCLVGIHTYAEGVHDKAEVEQYQRASVNARFKEQLGPIKNHSMMNGIPKPHSGSSPILEEALPAFGGGNYPANGDLSSMISKNYWESKHDLGILRSVVDVHKDSMREGIQELKSDVAKNTADIHKITSNLDTLTGKVDTLTGKVDTLTGKVDTLIWKAGSFLSCCVVVSSVVLDWLFGDYLEYLKNRTREILQGHILSLRAVSRPGHDQKAGQTN